MTSDSTVVPLRQPDAVEDPLTAVLRDGARRLLAQAVEAEAEAFLAILLGVLRQRAIADGYRLAVALVHPINRGSGGEEGDRGSAHGLVEPPGERGFVRPRRIPHEFAVPGPGLVCPARRMVEPLTGSRLGPATASVSESVTRWKLKAGEAARSWCHPCLHALLAFIRPR
jgi:hypothetical protein